MTKLNGVGDVKKEVVEQEKLVERYKDVLKEAVEEGDEEVKGIAKANIEWTEIVLGGLKYIISEAEEREEVKIIK